MDTPDSPQTPAKEAPPEIILTAPELEMVESPERSKNPSRRVRRPALRQRYFLAGGLFLATVLSTIIVGGFVYSAAVMAILLFHEMGHYLQAKRYHVPASLPYFIPMPINPLGTMGAVIVQAAGFANRKALFDIAISGPLAGLLLALPITYWGLTQSEYKPFPDQPGTLIFGDPLILSWMAEWILGPQPEGKEIVLNPLLFAGWVGIFITALNLIPIGQLDGGHILYTLLGRKAHYVAMGIVFGAAGCMYWYGSYHYAMMLVLVLLMGVKHPPTSNDAIELGWPRIILGWLTLLFIIVGFTPEIIKVT